MEEFKCSNCGHNKAHEKQVGDESTDKIIDFRNPKIDARVFLKACEKCHVVHAFWESFKNAEDISKRDKDVAEGVLNKDEVTSGEIEQATE